MRRLLEESLLKFKRKTITFDELEDIFPKTFSYVSFAELILQFEREGVLEMVKSKGRNSMSPSLAYHYRIHKQLLKRAFYQQLQKYRFAFHNEIDLDAYFKLDPSVWLADLPYLEKINTYITNVGLPVERVPAPERSFALVGDEKWIEGNGETVLHRVKLWDKMKIFPVSDPLMFAVNPHQMTAKQQLHLIVENKTTYQALVPVLSETVFSTLIYGSGNKIPKSIENFPSQFPVQAENHYFLYFGDIDRSGISIWSHLNERERTIPALPFYEACFQKEEAYGKTNQRLDVKALDAFSAHFPKNMQINIRTLLEKGAYYPQEVLKTAELQEIIVKENWRALTENNLNAQSKED